MRRPRTYLVIAMVLTLVGLFALSGAASGVVLAVASLAYIACFMLNLRGERPDDRAAGSGIFGGYL